MFLVMRTHTMHHDAKKVLWEVSSRPFLTREAADSWCEFMQNDYLEDNPRGPHKFFVIETDFGPKLLP